MACRNASWHSGVAKVRAARDKLKNCDPPIFYFFTSNNGSMTIATLAINDCKKQICRSRMYKFKNPHTVISSELLTKTQAQKANLMIQFGKYI